MCVPLAIAAAGVQAAGTLVQGYSAMQQGNYESKIARRNAAAEVEAARESIEIGGDERRDYWRKISQIKGQNIASMAANGLDVDFGAGAAVQQDTQRLANEDAGNLYRNIEERTKGRLINAQNFVAEAKAEKQKGKPALIGAAFGAASSLMGGFQQQAAIRAKVAR